MSSSSPIVRAVLDGDEETGVTIMQMDAGLDTGPIIEARSVPISARETSGTLTEKLARLGGEAIVAVLSRLRKNGRVESHPQPATGISYASKVAREESVIDWSRSAGHIDRLIRAFDPAPGASTSVEGDTIKLWRALPVSGRFGSPGSVVRADAAGLVVACGEGGLAVLELQRAGAKRMPAASFLAGRPIPEGTRLGG